MKFGMDVMPFDCTLKSYFCFPKIGNTNIADKETCEVGSTPAYGIGAIVGRKWDPATLIIAQQRVLRVCSMIVTNCWITVESNSSQIWKCLLHNNGTSDHSGARKVLSHCWKTVLRNNDLGGGTPRMTQEAAMTLVQ
jgi:hypothetical protein